jgi:hyperosmotically inducible periplasmic protein
MHFSCRGSNETIQEGVFMKLQKLFGFLGSVAVAAAMTTACAQTDAGISTSVKSRLAADDTVKAYRIDVDTKDKVVTLRGEVDTPAARDRAVEVARATSGVRDVVDVLKVAPATAATSGRADDAREAARDDRSTVGDAGITASIKTKMLADSTVGGLKINVDTTNGVVSLTGDVKSAAEKRRAVAIARETDGVKSVNDKLEIVK